MHGLLPVRVRNKAILSKVQSSDSLLQASTQALTLEDDGDLVTFKGWDGHSIDGSPSLGTGQATGRVDVPVDAIATSFGCVDVALLHNSSQCVVLVNQGSHVEKKEKTVFVKRVEGKTTVRRVVDSTQIWELLDEHHQDTIRCYGRLLGRRGGGLNGSGSHRKTFRVSGHAHCVGRSGCGPQKIDVFMILFLLVRLLVQLVPDLPARWTPEQEFWSTCAFCGSAAPVSS